MWYNPLSYIIAAVFFCKQLHDFTFRKYKLPVSTEIMMPKLLKCKQWKTIKFTANLLSKLKQ